jgi:hypothetical protein
VGVDIFVLYYTKQNIPSIKLLNVAVSVKRKYNLYSIVRPACKLHVLQELSWNKVVCKCECAWVILKGNKIVSPRVAERLHRVHGKTFPGTL